MCQSIVPPDPLPLPAAVTSGYGLGEIITLTFAQDMNQLSTPLFTDFEVAGDGGSLDVDSCSWLSARVLEVEVENLNAYGAPWLIDYVNAGAADRLQTLDATPYPVWADLAVAGP